MTEWGGSCGSLQAVVGPLGECCGSCHSDDDDGYELSLDVEHGGLTYRVCCAIAGAFARRKEAGGVT